MFQKGGNETVFKVAQVFIGAIIGRQGTNLNRLKSKTDTDIYIEDDADDQFKQITIVGDPEKRKTARAFIQEIIVSIKFYFIFCTKLDEMKE